MITLVLLPGMDGTGLLFADFISALGPEFNTRVATYPADPPLGYDELEVVARSFLPRDEPFILLAESFSGPIAISIAASKPTGLVGLILCCSFARNPRAVLAGVGSFLGPALAKLLPMAILEKYLLGRPASVRTRSALRQALAAVSFNTLRARAKVVAIVDVTPKLGALEIPVLYLRATHDLLVTRAACDLILEKAPDARVAELKGPHLLLQAAPIAAAAVIRDFARSTIEISNHS